MRETGRRTGINWGAYDFVREVRTLYREQRPPPSDPLTIRIAETQTLIDTLNSNPKQAIINVCEKIGAFFLPEALQQKGPISPERFILLVFSGLLSIAVGVILIKRGEK